MKEEGFTLLELLVVCLVLALLAALSVPVVRVTERMRLEREAALLASDFRYLQEISRTERTADGKGEWRLRPKLVVEAHRYYFLLPWAAGEVLGHVFPDDVYAVPSGSSARFPAAFCRGVARGFGALCRPLGAQRGGNERDVLGRRRTGAIGAAGEDAGKRRVVGRAAVA